jgi:hypothetical protein
MRAPKFLGVILSDERSEESKDIYGRQTGSGLVAGFQANFMRLSSRIHNRYLASIAILAHSHAQGTNLQVGADVSGGSSNIPL